MVWCQYYTVIPTSTVMCMLKIALKCHGTGTYMVRYRNMMFFCVFVGFEFSISLITVLYGIELHVRMYEPTES